MSNDKPAQALRDAVAFGKAYGPYTDPQGWEISVAEKVESLIQALATHEAEKQYRCCEKAKGPGEICQDCAEASAGYSQAMVPVRENEAEKQAGPVAAYTEGHCAEKRKPGGCTLHNLHCSYPACDRKAAPPSPLTEQAGPVAEVQDWPDDRTRRGIVPLVSLDNLSEGTKLYTQAPGGLAHLDREVQKAYDAFNITYQAGMRGEP